MIYLVTHGEREHGPDPLHTQKGLEQLWALRSEVSKIAVSAVIVGTGKRFSQIYHAFMNQLEGVPVKFSPMCGSADSLEKDGSIVLTNGQTVHPDDYLGIFNSLAVDPWRLVFDLPDDTLLCAGGELLTALGMKGIYDRGHLYEIDLVNRTGRKIA